MAVGLDSITGQLVDVGPQRVAWTLCTPCGLETGSRLCVLTGQLVEVDPELCAWQPVV
jgi:hypothetical protein